MQMTLIHVATSNQPPKKFLMHRKGDLQISLFYAVQQHVDQIFIVSEGKRGNRQPDATERII